MFDDFYLYVPLTDEGDAAASITHAHVYLEAVSRARDDARFEHSVGGNYIPGASTLSGIARGWNDDPSEVCYAAISIALRHGPEMVRGLLLHG